MGSPLKKKGRTLPDCFGDEDRLSALPDELIHKVLSFVDAKVAVQTSVLSKRWKLIWTTLPCLSFGWNIHSSPNKTYLFIRHALSNRNRQSSISELKLCIPMKKGVSKLVEYAILNNVQDLSLDLGCDGRPFKLSTLSTKSLKKLTLRATLKEFASKSYCWDLPALTTLHLKNHHFDVFCKLQDSCLTCLPALRTLCIDDWDLRNSSFSFSLPHLTTLCLSWCKLHETVWDFPALSSLNLYDVKLPANISDIFTTLVNLQNLTLFLKESVERDLFISCPQLLNLTIRIGYTDPYDFVVLAPKLQSFSSLGIFRITFGFSELENVNIKLQGWIEKWRLTMKRYNKRFTNMLPGLGNAKNLTFDLESIKLCRLQQTFLVSRLGLVELMCSHTIKYVHREFDAITNFWHNGCIITVFHSSKSWALQVRKTHAKTTLHENWVLKAQHLNLQVGDICLFFPRGNLTEFDVYRITKGVFRK